MADLPSSSFVASSESAFTGDAAYWAARYRENDTPWDMGHPTPVFAAMLECREFPILPTIHDAGHKRPTRLFVPGCGTGHDAMLFARAGYAVTAVDVAAEAIATLNTAAETAGVALDARCANIFELPAAFDGQFDAVLEYTCFCAIPPAKRADYVRAMARLLAPGGVFVGLFFPIETAAASAVVATPTDTPTNNPSSEGPPFAVRPDDVCDLFETAWLKRERMATPIDSHPARAGRERLMVFRKPTRIPPPPCNRCNAACCRETSGHRFAVMLLPSDPVYEHETTFRSGGFELRVLPYSPRTGACPYLVKNMCSIHDRRPHICREFNCRRVPIEEDRHDDFLQLNPHVVAIQLDATKSVGGFTGDNPPSPPLE